MSFFSQELKFNLRKLLLYIGIMFFFFIVGLEADAEYRSPYLQPRKKEVPKERPRPKLEPGKTPVYLIADTMSYNNETRVYTARGNVVIKQLDQTLKADYVEYNYNTQVARANGHVVYREEGGDNLVCNYFEINMRTKEGFAKEGKVFYQRDNVYLNGSNIEKLGEKQYRVTDGEITTCDGKRPAWKFKCKKVDITVEGLAKAKDATFKIKEIPVAYFPYLAYPALVKRQSGFLVPSFGTSSTEGIKLDNAYYWAISPNTDATFYLDVATKKGVGVGGEYRYITSETGRGRFYGYFIEEQDSYQEEKYSHLLDREKDRWNIVYEGKKDFDPTFFARAKVDTVSDRQFYHDYGNHTNLRSAEQTQSSASLTKHWGNFSLAGEVEYNYSLLDSIDYPNDPLIAKGNDLTLQRYPQIILSGVPLRVPHTPLYCSLNSDYAHFYREERHVLPLLTQQGDRVEFDPRIMLPLSVMKNFFLQTEAGFLQTSYFNTSDDKGLDNSRSLFHLYSNLSTKFMKVYNLGSGNKLRHTIEPEFIYTYIPDQNQNDLPRYDEFDNIAEENRVALAITNRLVSKAYSPGGLSTIREILFLRLGQYYDLTTSDDPFSDFFLELKSQPISWMRLKSKLAYDIYDQRFDLLNGSINFEDHRKDSLELEYRYTSSKNQTADPLDAIAQPNYLAGIQLLNGGMGKIDTLADTQFITQEIEEFDSRVNLVLTQTASLFFQNRTNLNEQKTLETLFGLDYHLQCWGSIISYRVVPKTAARDREKRLMFEFYLKGIGKVGGIRAGD
ncbi:MAG TPA: LPS assembly protein LptD [Thermodesulfobacteriota bacterium]|nr:LPS assembly protein LptD [Thermodesulfobacteriota bacterium]